MMQLRPNEGIDDRLLLVAVTEEDLKYQDEMGMSGKGSLSDTALTLLLDKLEPLQPQVIGLDIYRDRSHFGELTEGLHESDRLITICKIGDPDNRESVRPPKEVPKISWASAIFYSIGMTLCAATSWACLRVGRNATHPIPSASWSRSITWLTGGSS